MNKIREATHLDQESIREVYLCAFPKREKHIVAALAVSLLYEHSSPEAISLVAEIDGEVVGHAAFSPVAIDNNVRWKGYILAPLGVKPRYQRRRIGSQLIASGIEQLSEMAVNVLFVYGDPKYYARFGFKAETASKYLPPYELQYPFGWQAIILQDEGSTQQYVKIVCVPSLRDPTLW